MRRAIVTIVLVMALTPSWAIAQSQDAEALRRELEALRRQQQESQKTIDALSRRLERLEAQPAPVVTAPAAPMPAAPAPVAQGPVTPGPDAPPTPAPPSAMDLIRPRQPFALYQQRGSGQLLFDMGVAGDFVGNLTQRNVQKANGGTFDGRENRFFPREVELNIFGQIDPYARADVKIEAGEEEAGGEIGVGLAEATITLLALPYGTQAKLGQMRNRFGWSNVLHEHDLPWVDRPDVYRYFFGGEGLVEKGVEATWVPDFLPFYLELLGGVFNGDNEVAFGHGRLTDPLVTGRVRAYFDLTDTHALQVGTSVASGETPEQLRSTLLGFDLKYKYRPEGWLHPLLTVGGEAIYSIRRVDIGDDTGAFDERTRDRFGWYGWAELQPWRQWAVGARYDSTQYPVNPGWQWAVEPYVSFRPSEFLLFRLAYKHTERTHRDGFNLNGGSARRVEELLFQASFILGAHPAHSF
ncbi:MAG TPA: hypothetical protein VGU22_12165 [Methylomirabilota bacterium]|jgi:hypothetical protein|nr:hypothetical protein [Methylomirabilota bacterium]